MGFDYKTEGSFHRVPKLEGAPACVYFTDVFSTASKDAPNPVTGSMFLLEYSDAPEPAPFYEYDETGVVLKGELHIDDNNGNKATLLPGDTFFIHRGTSITFSTPRFAVAYKVGGRHKM
ncbi:ethanolamine utilization protein [Thozetella sp. PMI_491]|nr:ethanolamine utilization protein [Thozetella sp. PMI_491]